MKFVTIILHNPFGFKQRLISPILWVESEKQLRLSSAGQFNRQGTRETTPVTCHWFSNRVRQLCSPACWHYTTRTPYILLSIHRIAIVLTGQSVHQAALHFDYLQCEYTLLILDDNCSMVSQRHYCN